MTSAARALFIDKDGTLVEDVPYNADPARIRLLDGVADGLRALARSPFSLFVVSNQPGLALGRFTESEFRSLREEIARLFEAHGCRLSGFYFCPHDPAGAVAEWSRDCDCRKPRPGLLIEAARRHRLRLPESWMIGDILNDVEAGRRAGCRTVFIDNGHETEWRWSPWRRPDVTVARFDEAVAAILQAASRPEARRELLV